LPDAFQRLPASGSVHIQYAHGQKSPTGAHGMTTPLAEPKRWQEIATIWKDNRWLYIVAGLLLGVLLTPALQQITGDWNALIGNLVPEALGIIFTVLILERLAENRQHENYKQNLIRQASSVANDIALDAIEQLHKAGWLTDDNSLLQNANLDGANLAKARLRYSNLQGINFSHANLQQADLLRANLQQAILEFTNFQEASFVNADLRHANLSHAKLQQATLMYTDLQQANLWCAKLQGADLMWAKLQQAELAFSHLENASAGLANFQQCYLYMAYLQNADLRSSNLQDAYLAYAKLQNAILVKANLRNAILKNTEFNEKTVLPDAEAISLDDEGNKIYSKYWTPETDMTRYTNPEHPDFWSPEYLKPDYSYALLPDWVKEQRRNDTGK
jgi:uncharacterized protein YjbI with pentapeptide repeats